MECLGSTGVTSLAWWAMFQQVVFGGLATMYWWVEVVSTETSYRSTARCLFRQSFTSSQYYWFDQILPFVFRVGSWSCWNKKPDIKYQHSIEMRLTSVHVTVTRGRTVFQAGQSGNTHDASPGDMWCPERGSLCSGYQPPGRDAHQDTGIILNSERPYCSAMSLFHVV